MDTFGDERPKNERQSKMVVPARAANSIEIELRGQLAEATGAQPIFIDDDDDANDYGGVSLRTALDVSYLIEGDIASRFATQIAIAHNLGSAATTELYELACKIEGVNPWPAGR